MYNNTSDNVLNSDEKHPNTNEISTNLMLDTFDVFYLLPATLLQANPFSISNVCSFGIFLYANKLANSWPSSVVITSFQRQIASFNPGWHPQAQGRTVWTIWCCRPRACRLVHCSCNRWCAARGPAGPCQALHSITSRSDVFCSFGTLLRSDAKFPLSPEATTTNSSGTF